MATKKSAKVQDWQQMMEEWFMKLPALPKNARETLVKITPWIALIFGILGILGSLAGMGILGILSPFMLLGGGYTAGRSLIAVGISLVSSVLLLMAYSGTKANKMQGWHMLFWSEAVSVIASVVDLSLGGILFNAIGFYLLYQIKAYYK